SSARGASSCARFGVLRPPSVPSYRRPRCSSFRSLSFEPAFVRNSSAFDEPKPPHRLQQLRSRLVRALLFRDLDAQRREFVERAASAVESVRRLSVGRERARLLLALDSFPAQIEGRVEPERQAVVLRYEVSVPLNRPSAAARGDDAGRIFFEQRAKH